MNKEVENEKIDKVLSVTQSTKDKFLEFMKEINFKSQNDAIMFLLNEYYRHKTEKKSDF